jgi:NADH dehydrogenase
VTGATADEVELNSGEEKIPTRTLIWTGGTKPNPALDQLPAAKTPRGAVKATELLNIPGHPEAYVIGDGAAILNRRDDRLYPPVAPVAIRQGVRAAGNIVNALQGRAAESFQFDFTGNIVGLGGGTALVNLLGLKFHGRLGWWFYRIAYLQRLVGVKNKVALVLTLWLNALFDRDISCET